MHATMPPMLPKVAGVVCAAARIYLKAHDVAANVANGWPTVRLGSRQTGDTPAAYRSSEAQLGHPRVVHGGSAHGVHAFQVARSGDAWEARESARRGLLSQHLVLRVLREARLRVHGRTVEAEDRVFCVAGESLASVGRVGGAGSRGVGRKGAE